MAQGDTQNAPREEVYVSAHTRARMNRSGIAAARAMRGIDPYPGQEEAPKSTRARNNVPPNNFASPTEFNAGPRQPGKVTSGIRRVPNANKDSVSYMLTDEYLMGGARPDSWQASDRPSGAAGAAGRGAPGAAYGAGRPAPSYGAPAGRGVGAARQQEERRRARNAATNQAAFPKGHRCGVINNCIVTAKEDPYRTGVKFTHPPSYMDAPYYEDYDPKPARDEPVATGKRHLKPPHYSNNPFRELDRKARDGESLLPPCKKSSNRANESVDVLNLNLYSAEELNEKQEPERLFGPRKYEAPDMPARRPPMIKPINARGKREHDVLGTGRWGQAEKEHPRGLGRGYCRPPRDTANLFRGGNPPKEENERSGSAGRRPGNARSNSPSAGEFMGRPSANNNAGNRRRRPDPEFPAPRSSSRCRKQPNNGNILRYYDPNVDGAMKPAPRTRPIPRNNIESRPDREPQGHALGRGRGEFCKNGRESAKPW